MKLETLLILTLACHEPILPHPTPYIPRQEKTDSSPTIILTYAHDLPLEVRGHENLVLKSRTHGGSLKIEFSDDDTITKYSIFLNGFHLSCSNDDHPGNPQRTYLRKQYAVPLHGILHIAAEDEKGNTSRVRVMIERD